MKNNEILPREINGQYYFTTSQAGEILGQTSEWVSRNCGEGRRFNSIKEGGIHLIPESDVLENIDKMDRDSITYKNTPMERLFHTIQSQTSDSWINFFKRNPQWYSKDYINGYKRATEAALRAVQKYNGEVKFTELIGKLDK